MGAGRPKKNQAADDATESDIQHRLLLEENEIDISDLPREIKNAMRGFNTKLTEYEKTGESSVFYELKEDDANIADMITVWLEEMEAEEEEEQDDSAQQQSQNQNPNMTQNQNGSQKNQQAPQTNQSAQPQQTNEEQNNSQPSNTDETAASTEPVAQTPAAVSEPETGDALLEKKIKAQLKNVDGNMVIDKAVLESIIGREAEWPDERVGSLRLEKQFLKPFYKLK
jgi:DNA mismatch repair ATPase MutL